MDSLRMMISATEHASRHARGTGAGTYGMWAGMIAVAVALTRFEKMLEWIGRLLGKKQNGNGETKIITRSNGSPCAYHEGLVADIRNLVDTGNKHHAEQREDMKEIRMLLLQDRRQ